LVPGAAASLAGYWPEARSHRRWLATLALPSLVGGAAGSLLLLATPEPLFARLAPALVLFATLLFALGNRRRPAAGAAAPSPPAPGRAWRLAQVGQLGVAIYGGYFGAGIGILMLAILLFLGLSNIHAMNGLKNFFGLCINAVAAAVFVASGAVAWSACLPVLAGAIAGGYLGARLARFVGQRLARGAVVAIGVLVAGILLIHSLR
jgi:uncharacterized membrane protein YfcA